MRSDRQSPITSDKHNTRTAKEEYQGVKNFTSVTRWTVYAKSNLTHAKSD